MMTVDQLLRVEEYLRSEIPITRAMGIRVVPRAHSFAIEAPVALNYNHMRTAFGGSINAVATLAAYAWLWLRIGGESAQVVVQESSMKYLAPVRNTIRAHCDEPSATSVSEFASALAARGKATLQLAVTVEDEDAGSPAAQFSGRFVAIRHR